jgi:hypothetical protein
MAVALAKPKERTVGELKIEALNSAHDYFQECIKTLEGLKSSVETLYQDWKQNLPKGQEKVCPGDLVREIGWAHSWIAGGISDITDDTACLIASEMLFAYRNQLKDPMLGCRDDQ